MTREHIERWREWIAEHPQQPPGATVLCDLALRGLEREGMVHSEPSVTLSEILRTAAHIEKNGFDVARFGGEMKDEGRCRELCAMYLREFVSNYHMGARLKALNLSTAQKERI